MKILYVITKSNWGGAQRNVFDLATAMRDRGHDVWVALGGNGLLKEKLEAAGIYTFTIDGMGRDISIGKDFSCLKQIMAVIKDKKPDILHLHSPKAAGLGAVAGRLLGVKKIIVTVHGWSFNEDRPVYEKALIAVFSWLTMTLAHTTIVLSERENTQGSRFPWTKAKLKLIPLGIKAPTFYSIEGSKTAIAKAISMDAVEFSKKTVVGTVTELHKNKGLSGLIDAFVNVAAEKPSAILVIIGDGEEHESLATKIKQKNLEGRVFLAGYIDGASEYLKSFNIFVLSSIKEGLPYAILEAGCAGLPAVATTVGGVPEIVDDMKSGILVQPRNSRELGHAISFMIDHPEDRKKYGSALKEKIATKYSLDKMLWLTESLYQS